MTCASDRGASAASDLKAEIADREVDEPCARVGRRGFEFPADFFGCIFVVCEEKQIAAATCTREFCTRKPLLDTGEDFCNPGGIRALIQRLIQFP